MLYLPWRRRKHRRKNIRPEFVLRPPRPARIVVQRHPDILFLEWQAVRRTAFEVFPYLFNGVELGNITRKAFDMKARMLCQESVYNRPFVDFGPIQQENNMPVQMFQECVQEISNVLRMKVVLLKTDIDAHALTLCRNRQGGQSRYPVPTKAIADDRCFAFWPPHPAPCWNEQEPALVDEHEMGPKFSRFF